MSAKTNTCRFTGITYLPVALLCTTHHLITAILDAENAVHTFILNGR
jgi:hypothetical protein